jgi:aminoglycoside phosphotransferase (APT) family kinase protein
MLVFFAFYSASAKATHVTMPDIGISSAALTGWMDQQGLGRGPISNSELLTGGTQNLLMRFRRSGRDYVLRRPPLHPRANSNEAMRREARVLAALANTAVPHPRLIAALTDETVFGIACYLMEPVLGFNATMGLPALHAASAEVRHHMGLNLVDGIAQLGGLNYIALGLASLGNPDGFLERQVNRWSSQLASYADLSGWTGPGQLPGVERVANWLEANRPATFVPGIMHGDYHLANVMYRFDGPILAAIVDWELTTIGDPLLDLGWLLATWPDEEHDGIPPVVTPWGGFPSANELIDRYRAHCARDLSAINWYAVLACFKLGIILEGTHARACAGQAPRDTGDRLHEQAVKLLRRALRWIG